MDNPLALHVETTESVNIFLVVDHFQINNPLPFPALSLHLLTIYSELKGFPDDVISSCCKGTFDNMVR